MKLSYKDTINLEVSIEELTQLFQIFMASASGLTSKIQMPSMKEDEECKKDESADKEVDISDIMDKPVSDGKTWITNTQLMKEFGLRSTSTIHSHIKSGFSGWKYETVHNRNRLLIDKDAFTEWYKNHEKKNLKGARIKGEPATNHDIWNTWASTLRKACRDNGIDAGKAFSSVYRIMTNDYGIVWDQLKKEFRSETGIFEKATIELVYWLQYERKESGITYRNLFESLLEDYISQHKAA